VGGAFSPRLCVHCITINRNPFMDLSFTPEQQALRTEVQRFQHLAPSSGLGAHASVTEAA
jgi:hypothetical protein